MLYLPRGVLDEILNLIESVSEGFPTYSRGDNAPSKACGLSPRTGKQTANVILPKLVRLILVLIPKLT